MTAKTSDSMLSFMFVPLTRALVAIACTLLLQLQAQAQQSNASSQSEYVRKVMKEGSLFVANQGALKIYNPICKVILEPQAAVFIVQVKDSLIVYNFGEDKQSKAAIQIGHGDPMLVADGHAILVTRNTTAAADAANPLPTVRLESLNPLGVHGGRAVFDCAYPLYPVLYSAPQFRQLLQSENKESRELAEKLIKRAAIVQQLER